MRSVIRVRASHSRSKTLREPDRVALPTTVARLIIPDLVFFSQRHLTFKREVSSTAAHTWQYQCTLVNKLEAPIPLSVLGVHFLFSAESDNNARKLRLLSHKKNLISSDT